MLTLILIISAILLTAFTKNVELHKVKIDLINEQFPEAKQEVMETFVAIAESVNDGDMDK